MSGWVWAVLILVAAVASGLAFALEETHKRGERYEPRTLVIKQPGFYGSMSLADDRTWGELHPADPVPWEDLQSDARIEDDRDGDQTAAWFHGLSEDRQPEPIEIWEAEVRAEAGLIVGHYLDPGPGVDRPPPPGPDPCDCDDPYGTHLIEAWHASGFPVTWDGKPEPTRLASAADVGAARPWLDVQLEDLYVWVREVLAA